MYTFLVKLKDRAQILGNHVRKQVRSIDEHGDILVRRLEQKGVIDQVHLWKEARNPDFEMDVILANSNSLDEKLSFLGCYYGIQFLHMNLRALDLLFLNLKEHQERMTVYKEMQFRLGIRFRRLNATYMAKLLDLFLNPENRPTFAICGVGTRYDLDDLDLGIIDDASGNREELNQAIGYINSEMFRWAVPLHLHLSQYVGEPGFSASIQEYQELLEREIHDFIIISEMISAKFILGDEKLFRRFEEQVTARYYYRPNQSNPFHEGYLRGLLGEVRSLLHRQLKHDVVVPKEDAIRMIRGLIYCEKTIFSIKSANNYEILNKLETCDSAHASIYRDLEQALLFIETFRFLYQILVIQDEEIPLNQDQARDNLELVAEYMGYSSIGNIEANVRLVTHYYEYVELAKERTEQIFEVISNHLQTISVFSHLKKESRALKAENQSQVNVAEKFAELIAFFRGTKFWDDVISVLELNEAAFLQKLITDLLSLPEKKQQDIIQKFIEISHYSFQSFLSFLLTIENNQSQLPANNLVSEMNQQLFESMKGVPDDTRRLAKVFSHYPQQINNYLLTLTEEEQREFTARIDTELWEEETQNFQPKLLKLARFHYHSSKYFKRFFQKIVQKYPDCILYLDESDTLKHWAEGLLGEVDRHLNSKLKKNTLGDYYNIEFLRIGFDLINGIAISTINTEFTDFSDNYLQTLFDICRNEVYDEWANRIATFDLLAVYVTGGHARCQAFDDDYDIIVILDSDNPEINQYASRIVARMNSEIIKRGVLPHFRFSEHTGSFVTTMTDLKNILSANDEGTFIDKAQLIGCRRVVGSSLFDEKFETQIIKPYILAQKSIFIKDMRGELLSRHGNSLQYNSINYNIKECLGGLRDIEMFYLILKAHFELLTPINDDLIVHLCEVDPSHSAAFIELKELFDSLKHIRDAYRLVVTADNVLDPEYLDYPAEILGFGAVDEKRPGENLLLQFERWTKRAISIICEVLDDLKLL